jgi:DNA-binding NarL/FixJ family response regulator
MIKIILGDDHQLIREGIKKTLAPERDMEIVGEAADMPSLLSMLDERQADVVLLELSMSMRLSLSPPSEMAALRTLRDRFPQVRVLVITSHPESQCGVDSLREGASGYICKSMSVDVIAHAVRKVAAGAHYVSESLAELLAHELTAPKAPSPHELLTEREIQVLVLLASGLSVKQVAGRLSISISSVNTYRNRIFSKMRLKTNAELIRYAVTHDLAC